MKKLLMICFLFTLLTNRSKAQDAPTDFLGFGMGLHSTGILAVTYEHIFKDQFGLRTSAGSGLWGYKFGMGGRYYLKDAYSGSVGMNLSYSIGATGLEAEMGVIENNKTVTKTVTYDMHPVTELNLSYAKFWRMGKRARFNLEVGYSVPLNGKSTENYTVVSPPGAKLSDDAEKVLIFSQPGGFMLGIGFTFAL